MTSSKPPEELSFDLVVIGGGLAGLCAAVAAARHGAQVALVQDRPVLGGNCSSEIRVVPHGATHSNAWAQETGLPYELLSRDRALNHATFFDHGLINSRFDLTLIEFARAEPRLRVFFNTTVRAVDSSPVDPNNVTPPRATPNGLGRVGGHARVIHAVRGSQLGSEKEIIFRARQFIDATGDGTVGFLAGADFLYGREGRSEFGENLAPLVADNVTMGSTITMQARDTGRPAPFTPPPGVRPYRSLADLGLKRSVYHLEKSVFGGYWWLEVCNPFHQIDDNQAIRDELHAHVLGVWDFLKNHGAHREALANHALEWVGMIPGKRESRRLVGDVIVCEHDVHRDRRWPDAVAYAGWWIDLHIPGGILNKTDPGERENVDRNYKHWIRIPIFTLPLRAFYSRNVRNLWMAGRCLSVTHVALGPSRVMQTLGHMGHAVGLAAAYALEHDLSPREVAAPDGPHIHPLRQRMLRDDVRLVGVRNTDPDDLALDAVASATSEAVFDLGEPDTRRWLRLGAPHPGSPLSSEALGMVVPVTANRIDVVSLYLRNETARPARLVVGVQPMERIWDRDDRPALASVEIDLPANHEGWCDAPLAARLAPGRPYRITLAGPFGALWAASARNEPGSAMQYLHVCPGGPEEKNRDLPGFQPSEVIIPAYRHWRQLTGCPLALRLSPESRPFGAGNINNGHAWVESMPNLWVSDPARPLPQHCELAFPSTRRVGRVEVSFDTNLNRAMQGSEGYYRAPECARDWRVWARVGGGWRVVHEERDNYQRKRVARFEPVAADALRLEVLSTNGVPEARVYELRAYAG
jgi:Pyruvate/2-oxoglutarate dehydrogenase complex, dihydrolipoamide dehydrogenase (E3) component, and related enzymes